MKRERSSAHPVLDLATAYRILRQELQDLGTAELKRDEIARRLGYEAAMGGMAARKVGAMTHYGLLDRRGGVYGLSPLGLRLQALDLGEPEFSSAIRAALRQPALFRAVLDRYWDSGELPGNLRDDLAALGIKEHAIADAEEVFRKSALFAGVIDTQGVLRKEPGEIGPVSSGAPPVTSAAASLPEAPKEGWHRVPLMLAGGKQAFLEMPPSMTWQDYVLLGNMLVATYENLPEHLGLERPPEQEAPARSPETPESQRPVLPFPRLGRQD